MPDIGTFVIYGTNGICRIKDRRTDKLSGTKKEYYNFIEAKIDESLSGFEKQVLSRYIQGESYVDIANKLNSPVKSIDNAIQRIRKKHKLTQVQLADLVHYNEGTIANIENDSYQTFSLEFVYVVSKKLNEPIMEFFEGLEEKIENNESIN